MEVYKKYFSYILTVLLYIRSSSQIVTTDPIQDYYTNGDYDYYSNSIYDSSFTCTDNYFSIPVMLLCDGFADCADQSDEDIANCRAHGIMPLSLATLQPTFPAVMEFNAPEEREIAVCEDDELECPEELYLCIPIKSVCDGYEDCPGGEDELYCESSSFQPFHANDTSIQDNMPEQPFDNNKTDNERSLIHRLLNLSPERRMQTAGPPSTEGRLSFETPPIKLHKISPFANSGWRMAGFHRDLRRGPKKDVKKIMNSQKTTGGAGQTRAKKHYPRENKSTDKYVEEVLQNRLNVTGFHSDANQRHEISSGRNHTSRKRNRKTNSTVMHTQLQKATVSKENNKIQNLVKKLVRQVSRSLRTSSLEEKNELNLSKLSIQFKNQNSIIHSKRNKKPKIKLMLQFEL